MTKEQEIFEKVNRIRIDFFDSKYKDVHTDDELEEKYEALGDILNMLKENSAEIEQKNTELAEKNAEIEQKDKMINKMIDNIMTHYQVKTMRKMCCPTCKIGERACTYSGIHRNCIKQYFERKAKDGRN